MWQDGVCRCLIDIKGHRQVWGNCGVMTCGDNHCFNTHFLHQPGTALGCRGCGASWAPWTDRWPYSCDSQAGSGVGPEAHWDPEAGERPGGPERSTDYSTQHSTFCFSNTDRYSNRVFEVCHQNILRNSVTTELEWGYQDLAKHFIPK